MIVRFRFSNWIGCLTALAWLVLTASPNVAEPARRYFSDDLTIQVFDDAGNPIVIDLSANRKETESGTFQHYYFLSMLGSRVDLTVEDHFARPDTHVVTNAILKNFSNVEAEDVSTVEKYAFEFTAEGHAVEVVIPRLEGDFIVRNRPDYTKYLSEGEAIVSIDGKVRKGRALLAKIYAQDYSRYIYFPGYDDTRSESHCLTLWDREGNLIVLDKSLVYSDNPNYRAHTWALFKDAASRATRKAFSAEVRVGKGNDAEKDVWSVSIPEFDKMELTLKSGLEKRAKPGEGLIGGTFRSGKQSGEVRGAFAHHRYNME